MALINSRDSRRAEPGHGARPAERRPSPTAVTIYPTSIVDGKLENCASTGGRPVAVWQPRTTVIFDREGHASPSLKRSRRRGGGEPRTIERPRVRARLVDQGERARPPGGGSGCDPMPPSSPRESGAGSPEAESAGSGREDETAAGPRPKKARRGGRAPQSSRDHRKANRREDRGEGGPPSEWG